MARLLFILIPVIVAITIYTVVDCAIIDNRRVRGLSKPVWIVVILLLPVVGLVLWYLIGRGGADLARDVAPDDDPSFIGTLRVDSDQDDRIRQLEEELAALDAEEDIIRPRDEKKKRPDAADADKRSSDDKPADDDGHPTDHGHGTGSNNTDA
ncbi:PLDc N-terminal domain-containing protein [Microbacterium sp. MPKO10]|uniref:PLDc N-terminal domain-containing protein n=1 Tax=Microbacterium sp. MPKO10 TaxID=2989818 RepID=UPI00223549D1|nr:PLDc N-terminal domain-containing protein [Microbacterium sp. MPKO10]MCW4456942.1 PLDc N-terminal domain-containing protein [Microbacterium sp. MPKO10]